MLRNIRPFLAGVVVGVVVAIGIGGEERKKLQKKLIEQVKRLYEEYEGSMKDKVSKIKKFVSGQLN